MINLATETRKLKLLIKQNGYDDVYQVTFQPHFVSPSKEYIKFGGYWGDEAMGWKSIKDIEVIEIIEEMENEMDEKGEKKKNFLMRLFCPF